MLELHEFEIGRHQIEIGEIGLADDLFERPALIVVADRAIEGLVFADIEFGLIAVQGGEAGLGIEIDGEDPVAVEREILGKMRRCGGLAAAALEIDDGDDLKLLGSARQGRYLRSPLLLASR